MTRTTEKRPKDSVRESPVEVALRRLSASGFRQKFFQQDSTAAYEAEKAMDGGDFAGNVATSKRRR